MSHGFPNIYTDEFRRVSITAFKCRRQVDVFPTSTAAGAHSPSIIYNNNLGGRLIRGKKENGRRRDFSRRVPHGDERFISRGTIVVIVTTRARCRVKQYDDDDRRYVGWTFCPSRTRVGYEPKTVWGGGAISPIQGSYFEKTEENGTKRTVPVFALRKSQTFTKSSATLNALSVRAVVRKAFGRCVRDTGKTQTSPWRGTLPRRVNAVRVYDRCKTTFGLRDVRDN